MPEPVFEQGDTSVYGPGHASFVLNHNGDPTKNLIVYHSKKSESHGWEREIRYQYFNWDQYGTPVFGKPY